MTVVRRSIDLPGADVAAAEALWFDVGRWASWVDGFGSVAKLSEPWPDSGGVVVWDSNPYGRGHVTERSVTRRPGAGQQAEVEDDRLRGRQAVSFDAVRGGVAVTLTLDYAIKAARPGMFLVDLLFIRRAVGDSLRRTLEGFARELT